MHSLGSCILKETIHDMGDKPGHICASRLQGIQQCLRLVLAREIQRNVSYEYFVRLRPDLLVLTDLPNLEDAVLGRHCILARLRAANNIMESP